MFRGENSFSLGRPIGKLFSSRHQLSDMVRGGGRLSSLKQSGIAS